MTAATTRPPATQTKIALPKKSNRVCSVIPIRFHTRLNRRHRVWAIAIEVPRHKQEKYREWRRADDDLQHAARMARTESELLLNHRKDRQIVVGALYSSSCRGTPRTIMAERDARSSPGCRHG